MGRGEKSWGGGGGAREAAVTFPEFPCVLVCVCVGACAQMLVFVPVHVQFHTLGCMTVLVPVFVSFALR